MTYGILAILEWGIIWCQDIKCWCLHVSMIEHVCFTFSWSLFLFYFLFLLDCKWNSLVCVCGGGDHKSVATFPIGRLCRGKGGLSCLRLHNISSSFVYFWANVMWEHLLIIFRRINLASSFDHSGGHKFPCELHKFSERS